MIGVDASSAHPLPSVDTGDLHSADVGELNGAIEARYGIRVTVLRSLDHGQARNGVVERVHEVEVHGGVERCSLRWRAEESLALHTADNAVVAALKTPFPGVRGQDWNMPGWYNAASAWISNVLRDAGRTNPSHIRQIRTWASSCVLEVVAGQSTYYFKALPHSGHAEHAVTRFLAGNFPDSVPSLIAVDTDRRWLLLSACVGRNLEVVEDIASWAHAARRYGELQVACMVRTRDLELAGCPRREFESLPAAVAALAVDEQMTGQGEKDGLTKEEAAKLQALVPRLAELSAELKAFRIPNSIEHGDLWPGNIFVEARNSRIIDWEDVAIAHPFLSIAPLIAGLCHVGMGSKTNIDRLEQEYLSAFDSIAAPLELRRALTFAAPLCFLDLAVRYLKQRPSMVRLHPWMRDLVPQTIRLALARL
jgi:hypothetical protein